MLEALRARRRTLYRLWVARPGLGRPGVQAALAAARAADVGVEEVEAAEAARAAGAAAEPRRGAQRSGRGGGSGAGPDAAPIQSQGLVLEVGPLPEVPLETLLLEPNPGTTLVALDGVEDPQNVGAIARVAEALGSAGLILTRRRAPPLGPSVSRASAGAIEWLPTARVPNLVRALGLARRGGFWILGADPEGDCELFGTELPGPRVLVLGGEGRGLRRGTRAALDLGVRIPLAGRIGSLNVSAAAAAFLCELHRRDRLASSP